MRPLSTQRACDLDPQTAQPRWLIEELWTDQAVGVVGGEPKSFKSFLALDLAVTVAADTACLDRYRTHQPGPVLLFAGEDALHMVRQRIEGIARARGVAFDGLDVHVVTEATLRIDLEDQRQRLRECARRLRPRLLILDPFVRTHRIDENAVADVAPLLAFLRQLQREFHMAVVLVHHARKARHARPGQALRGSSEIHAWVDSALYLRRKDDQAHLTIEHRTAPAPAALTLTLDTRDDAVALRLVDPAEKPKLDTLTACERLLQALGDSPQPMTQRALREAARIRAATVGSLLADLIGQGRVRQVPEGYRLA